MTEHTFEPLEKFNYDVDAWQLAQRKLVKILTKRQRLLVLTGPLGSGKSSCMTSAIAETCTKLGWQGIQVPPTLLASSNRNLDGLDAVISFRMNVPASGQTKLVPKGSNEQAVGDIYNSANVSTVQQNQSVSVYLSENGQFGRSNEAYLVQLLNSHSQPCCFLVDNAHAIFNQSGWEESIFASIIKLCTVHPYVACVICVDDTWFGKLYSALESIGIDAPEQCYLSGIASVDARKYCESSVFPSLPTEVTESLITQIADSEGTVLPLRLQAILEVITNKAICDDALTTQNLGALLGIALRTRVRSLGKGRAADAIFVLDALSSLTETKYSVTVNDLACELSSIPRIQLELMVSDLMSLKILSGVPNGEVQFAHDGVRQAVLHLRHDAIQANFLRQIDQGTTNWFSTGACHTHEAVLDMCRLASHGPLSAPMLLSLVGSLFELELMANVDCAPQLKASVASLDSQYLHSLLLSRAARSGRGDCLDATEIFILMLCLQEAVVAVALSYVNKIVGQSELWSHKAVSRAISESENRFLLKALCNNRLVCKSEVLAPIVLNAIVGQNMELPSDEELYGLWDTTKSVAPIETLLVMAAHAPNHLKVVVAEGLSSGNPEFVGAALQVAVRKRIDGWQQHLNNALRANDLTVRRMAVIVLPEALDGGASIDVLGLFRDEPSDVIREALIDVSPDLSMEDRVSLLRSGISDSAEIVRESAVYATCWGLEYDIGLDIIRPSLVDPSPLVKEAVLYAYQAWKLVPPPEIVLRDARTGSESLRNAAWRFLKDVSAEDALDLISSVLFGANVRKSERLEALFAAKFLHLEESVRILDQFLARTDDADELALVIDILESVGSPTTISKIAVLSHHRSASVRERAVYALTRLGGHTAILELERCLFDPDPHVQARVIFGLGRLGEWRHAKTIRDLPRRSNNVSRAIEWYLSEHDIRAGARLIEEHLFEHCK